jgi:aminomethyltransferase folate-binding domain-containing protein
VAVQPGGWDAEITDISPETFIFGVQGPASLFILEQAAGESLRDIGFNRSRDSRVGGLPVRVLRTGISGELGYELHGSADDADAVWRLITVAGKESGIRHLGFRSQPVQHIETGIATNGLDYIPAAAITPGAPRQFRRGVIGGSFVPVNGFTDYFRKPGELGWAPRTLPAHDFLGRDALAADAASGIPGRVLVGLTWNPADVAGVLTALLGDGEVPEQMDIPRLPGPSFDQVLVAGTPGGSIDRAHNEPDPAGHDLPVRARPGARGSRHRGDRRLGKAGNRAAGDPGHRHDTPVQARQPPHQRHHALACSGSPRHPVRGPERWDACGCRDC